jgi:hypothetical protein
LSILLSAFYGSAFVVVVIALAAVHPGNSRNTGIIEILALIFGANLAFDVWCINAVSAKEITIHDFGVRLSLPHPPWIKRSPKRLEFCF